jgi:aspartate carbamoyltransferase regulatory subunit
MERAKELTVDDLVSILGSTVKHDNENKAITFLVMLLTYTEEDQINLGFLAESSTGKSYIPLELSWYFPEEDVIKLGYASPTAFFHDYGVLMHKEGIPVNFDMKPNKAAIKEDLQIEQGNVFKGRS